MKMTARRSIGKPRADIGETKTGYDAGRRVGFHLRGRPSPHPLRMTTSTVGPLGKGQPDPTAHPADSLRWLSSGGFLGRPAFRPPGFFAVPAFVSGPSCAGGTASDSSFTTPT